MVKMINRTMISTVLFALSMLLAAGQMKAQPEFRSDVQKEYDEHGNLKIYDTCWSWSYRWGKGQDIDSIMTRFFRDQSMTFKFDHPPFHFDSAWDFSSHFDFPEQFRSFFEELPFSEFHFPDIQLPDFSFPHDSLDQINPDWQDFHSPPPWEEKKSARGIEI
jgi:hypothetical protein